MSERELQRGVDVRLHFAQCCNMKPFDIPTITKLDAAIQQVEAAIQLFYDKRYAPALTLARAEGCLPKAVNASEPSYDAEGDLQGPPEPLFEMMMKGAQERYGKTAKEAVVALQRARLLAEA